MTLCHSFVVLTTNKAHEPNIFNYINIVTKYNSFSSICHIMIKPVKQEEDVTQSVEGVYRSHTGAS